MKISWVAVLAAVLLVLALLAELVLEADLGEHALVLAVCGVGVSILALRER